MKKSIEIPARFQEILNKDTYYESIVKTAASDFSDLLVDNKLYFFEDYTNHGIQHINEVLGACEQLIDDATFDILKSQDIALLTLAVILHDLGMLITFEGFKYLIQGGFDSIKIDLLDSETWQEEWQNYIKESRRFNKKQTYDIFGNENHIIEIPDLDSKGALNNYDRMFIGEFIRRHHSRLAHEIAIKGMPGSNDILEFAKELNYDNKKICGILARSHGISIRDTFDYLKSISSYQWKRPFNIEITFLMFVLRIADFLQIDESRVSFKNLRLKSFLSQYSENEFLTHLSITHIAAPYHEDPETIHVEVRPENNLIFIKIEQLLKSFQYELDMSWAVIGEIYGKEPIKKQPKLKYRRIISNINNKDFCNTLPFVHKHSSIKISSDLLKLLVKPLYGEDPIFGFRELLNNSVDSCFEQQAINPDHKSIINVNIISIDEVSYELIISDNGKGMTLNEIQNYFLTIGASTKNSAEWRDTFINSIGDSNVMRTGKFGIGVLAAFLLGDKINVKTRGYKSECGYSFNFEIESDNIEISKETTLPIGTTISIKLTKPVFEKLTADRSRWMIGYKINWTNLYTLNNPKINYKIDETLQELKQGFEPLYTGDLPPFYFETKSQKFNKVFWTFKGVTNYPITYNGFASDLRSGFNELKNITYMPKLRVFDFNGNLNISLNRNEIYVNNFDFLTNLNEEICKIIIANILFLVIDDNTTSTINPSGHFDVLFSKNGYLIPELLDCEKFDELYLYEYYSFFNTREVLNEMINKITSNHFIRIVTHSDYITNGELLQTKETHINRNLYNSNFDEKSQACIAVDKHFFENFKLNEYEKFKEVENESISPIKKRNDCIENELFNDWILLTFNKGDETFLAIDLLSLFAEHSEKFIIQKKIKKDPNRKNNVLLNKMYQKYFKDEAIPYDIELRRRQFPEAFEDLGKYINIKFK